MDPSAPPFEAPETVPPGPPGADDLVLALDVGSPLVSVAVGRGGRALAWRAMRMDRSSERLLAMVDACLAQAGAGPRHLGGILALRGPGSFTGLRVGLATALGLHQALGVPAAGLPTLRVLAAAVPEAAGSTVLAAVDALRGEWFLQRAGSPGDAGEEVRRLPAGELPSLAPAVLVGFGTGSLVASLGRRGAGLRAVEPGPLAPVALRLARSEPPAWDPGLLVRPLYLRPPAVTLPRR